MKDYSTPLSEHDIEKFEVGDRILLSGYIFCGRDAVLPQIVKIIENDSILSGGISLQGGVIFHTAVSSAGVGPTSSNKPEIESSMIPLSERAGVKMHLGKGKIKEETVKGLAELNAVYAVIPPVTALLKSRTIDSVCVAYPELGMEAFYRLKINEYPIIIAAAKGRSIY